MKRLKVTVKKGYEEKFKEYCCVKNIKCSQYKIEVLKNIFGVDCLKVDLDEIGIIIEKIEDMPIIVAS